MPSRLKELILEEDKTRYGEAQNVIFVGYRGVSGNSMSSFRNELRKEQVHLRVVRNRITVRAFADLGRPAKIAELFDGPTAIMDGQDPGAMAKAAVAFAKRNSNLEVKGGLVEGRVLNAGEVKALASLPSRQEMHGQIAALAMSPGGRIVAALAGPGGRIAGGLKAMADKETDEESGSPEPQAA